MILCTNLDSVENIKTSLPPYIMEKVFGKVETTNHYDPRHKICQKMVGKFSLMCTFKYMAF